MSDDGSVVTTLPGRKETQQMSTEIGGVNIVQQEKFEIIKSQPSGMSLVLPEDLAIEDWEQVGRRLFAEMRTAEDRTTRVNWWIGDWWAYGSGSGSDGRPRYGARAQAVAEGVFGLTFGSCRNLGSVARKFEASRRHDALPFTHHAEVASLSAPDADAMLQKAEDSRLSTRDLRKEVLRHRIATGDLPPREDDDPEHTELLAIARAWNRATVSARKEFYELAGEASGANYAEIDP